MANKKQTRIKLENDLLELQDWLNALEVHERNHTDLVLNEEGMRDIRMYLLVARHTLQSFLESVDAVKH